MRVEETDQLYVELRRRVVGWREEGKVVMVMGDFNGRIGLGRGGDEVVNRNGRRLLNWCGECDLEIVNAGMKCEGKWTWSRGDKRSTIDYMLIGREDEWRVSGMKVDDEGVMDVGSDHCVLEMWLQMGRVWTEEVREAGWKWKVDGRMEWEGYQGAVAREMEGLEEWIQVSGDSVEVVWEEWKRRVLAAAEVGIGKKRVVPARSRSWWDEDVEVAIGERRCACRRLRWLRNSGRGSAEEVEEAWEVYKVKRREVKRLIARKKELDRTRVLENIRKSGGVACKRFWMELQRSKKRRKQGGLMEVKDGDGCVVTEPGLVKERMRQYWQGLGRALELEGEGVPGMPLGLEGSRGGVGDVTEEVAFALGKLERGKAAGPDGVLNEMLMFGGVVMVWSLRVLFNVCMRLMVFPRDWCRSLVVPLFKEGEVEDLNNYRGIALSSTVGKVFERVLDGRVREVVEDGVLKEAQGGFRSGRSCADQVFVLRNVLEMRRKQGLDSVVAFLDVRKAYDTVWREGLWWKMRRYGIAENLVRLCMLFYVKVEACVVTGYGLTDWFVVEEGLRQGSVLSPVLYAIFVMDLVEDLEGSGKGVVLGGAYCGMLMFADDMAMLAGSEGEMEGMLDEVEEYRKRWRFQFNERKSKVMVISKRKRERRRWWLGVKEVEETDAYKYLGVWFDVQLRGKVHLEWMLKKAEEVRQLVGWLGRVNGVMEVERGRAIWELMGLPAVCYGDEVRWAGSKVMQGKLEGTQVQVGRKLLGASRTVASCAVRGELGWRTLKERREERMLRFVAKVQRMEDSRLTKVFEECRAEGLVWWKEVEGVLVRYGLGVGELDGCWLGIRKQLRMFCERRWREEVCGKRSLDLFSEVKRKLV